MARLLIVRSTSFQQLDDNFVHVLRRFPSHEIHLLTHAHGKELASKYAAVTKVLVYPHSSNFRSGTPIPEMSGQSYDDIMVPVSNLGGGGFANVFAFALSLCGGRIHRCNLVGEIVELPRAKIFFLLRQDRLYRALGVIFGGSIGLAVALWFIICLLLGRVLSSRSTRYKGAEKA
jgi:hypothetical protein